MTTTTDDGEDDDGEDNDDDDEEECDEDDKEDEDDDDEHHQTGSGQGQVPLAIATSWRCYGHVARQTGNAYEDFGLHARTPTLLGRVDAGS